MNTARAAQILHSPEIIEVTYQNSSVWIEDVKKQSNSAVVKNLSTDEVQEVPVTQLQERQ